MVLAEEIVVVIRGLASEASRWLDHFELAGIPAYAPQASSLESCPVVRWMAQLVKLELNDWTSHDLRLVVSSTFFFALPNFRPKPNGPYWRGWQNHLLPAAKFSA